jgi:hypothetical protein
LKAFRCRRWAPICLGLCASGLAAAGEPQFSAVLECPRRATPGRIVCEAELEVAQGKLAWGDVLVLEAPAFARPLRARVGPSSATMHRERRMRIQLALAATSAGEGRLHVRARAVYCAGQDASGSERCRPVSAEAETVVRVGPITEPSAGP